MRDRPVLLGSLAVVLAASGFGLLGVLSRFSYDAGLEPLSFITWRATFGVLVILAVVAVRRRSGVAVVDPRTLPRADRTALLVAALAALGLTIGMFVGFDIAAVAIVVLAFYTYPAMVALLEVSRGHETLDGIGWTALGLALGGMVLVVVGGLDTTGATTINPAGVVLGLGAALCQTAFVAVSRGRFQAVPSEQAMAWVLALTAIVCAVGSIATGAALDVPLANGRALVLVLITGTIAAGIPSILFLVGIRAIGGTRAGILMLIEPLVSVVLAAALLDEGLRPIQALGGTGILVAGLLLQRARPGLATRGAPLEAIEPAAVPARDGG